jgi:hypothetical protein
MTFPSPPQVEGHLQEVAEQFAQWRQSRANPRGSRIPESLWAEALTLAEVLPPTRVARSLKLKPHALKRRRGDHGRPPVSPRPSPSPAFVEVTAAPRPMGTTEVDIQRPDGARLRIRYSEAVPAALAAVVHTFLEPR